MNKLKNVLQIITLTILLSITIVTASGNGFGYTSGSSMEPTITDGTIIFSLKTNSYKKGDIVSIKLTKEQEKYERHNLNIILKRIVAIPGDTVEVEYGVVYVNGVKQDEFSYDGIAFYSLGKINASYVLGEDEYFVMGDNYKLSADSRIFGLFKKEQLSKVLWYSK